MSSFWPRPAIKLVLAGLLLSGGLIWAAASHVRAVAAGTEIVLQAQGYDPRGLLTGHFTQVSYGINRAIGMPKLAIDKRRIASPVWVVIVQEAGDWRVASLSLERPATAPAGSYLVQAAAATPYSSPNEGTADYDLRYGIERIYAQQSEAEALAQLLRAGSDPAVEPKLQVVAALGKDGRLRLKGVIAEGVRKDFTWW